MRDKKMCCFRAFLFLFVAGFHSGLWSTEAFNIESRHYTTYRKESASMFGFSVAEYRDRTRRGWVIVGAPEAQTSQPNVYRGGAVYRCDVAVDDHCMQVEFDNKENNYIKNTNPPYNLIQIDNKTLQWFGATVSTPLSDGGPILACAPRYVFFSVSQIKKEFGDHSRQPIVGNRRDPVGTCWTTNFTTSTEFSPCRTRNFGYHRQGSCQAGLGASVSRDGERIFIGAPGSWYWQGQLYSVMRRLENFPFVPPGNASFGVFPGQTYTQMLNNRGKVMFTKEGSPEEDDSYLGYSVTSGDFIGNGDSGTAVGMPRGFDLRGKVVLLTSNMTNVQNITGEQMGGYFGYALACGDIDGDGLDDLIVGAPMYTVPENPEMNFETGRIYIYYGKGPDKYQQNVTRDGESNRGRFGLSLAALGDIDRDGYGDFAVGAPYAGPEGRGAVYIYHGSREGVQEKYSQVIHAEDLSNRVQTFGFSVAGGLDLDGNLYPDMVVGSYESGTAMFFRSRPVIKMVPDDTFVAFGSSSKLISLDDKICTLSDTTRVTCLPLKACFKYTGDGVLSTYDFNVQYVLDVKKTKNPRLFFLEHEGKNTLNHTITVDRNQQFCRTVRVYVTPSIRDKLTSLEAEMRMSLAEERWPDSRPRDPRLPLRPVLATTSSRKDTLSIRKNCGSDNICTPDLQLSVTPNVNRYLLGSGNRLELDVLVQNANEDAFEATYNLKLPQGVNYVKIVRIDKAEIPVQCSAPHASNNNTLKCDIGNPLPKNNLVHFNVLLQPVDVHNEKSSYEFEMNVNSTNVEPAETTHDNIRHISLEIWVETELLIEGESKPKDIYYNPENYTAINVTTDVEYGPAFTHNFTIRNQGPSRIEEAEIFLIWPAATLAKDDLVYLLEQPETTMPLICASANANPLSLKLEQRRRPYSIYTSVHEHLQGSRKPINVHTGYEGPPAKPTMPTNPDSRWPGTKEMSASTERVLIHSGTSSLGIGDSMGAIKPTIDDRTLLENIDLSSGDAWERNRGFHEENKTQTVFHDEGAETVVDDSYRHRGGVSTNVNIKQTEIDRRYEEAEEIRRREEYQRHLEQERRRQELIIEQRREEERRKEAISGDREDHVGEQDFGIRLRSVNASRELNTFLNSLIDNIGYEIYHRKGHDYLQFMGRFRVSQDGTEYLEFKDGLKFHLLTRDGERSYSEGESSDRRFLTIEGQIIEGDDGKPYCRLKDDRRFLLQNNWEDEYNTDESSSWREEWSNREDSDDREVETYEQRTHEERRTSKRKYNVREERVRRDVNGLNDEDDLVDFDASKEEPGLEDSSEKVLPLCEAAKCVSLRCTLGRLEKDQEVSISARYRVKGSTLNKVALNEKVRISTQIVARVTRLPFIGKPAGEVVKSHEVFTNVQPTARAPQPDVVPLWVVVLSACAGTIILLLLIFLLHKCGFFKRNRPSETPETQPLNRNGHFQHGDDHM